MADTAHALFVIEVRPTDQSGDYEVVARWEGGANDGQRVQDVDSYHLIWNLSWDEERLFDRMKEGLAEEELRQIGTRLFNTLFLHERPVTKEYDRLLDPDHPSTLILRFYTPELSQYPWEAMFDGQRHVIERNVPLVRSIAAFKNRPPQPVQRLQVLYASASPENADHLPKAKQLYEDIETLLKGQARRGRRIDLDTPLHKVHRGQLATELGRKKHHVICLAMHGTPNHLLLHHSREESIDRLTASDLSKMLKGTPVRLVILVACDTAAQDDTQKPVEFARALLAQSDGNVSAVLAMQTPINQQPASEFIERLFFHLSQFERVDIAVAKARNILSQRDRTNRDTFAPVLYMQIGDGNLFRKQINWYLRSAILLGILLILGAILYGVNDLRRQSEAARLEILANEQRLQTVAQVSRIEAITASENGPKQGQPVGIGNSVWATGQDGVLRRHSGLPGEREFFVGIDSYPPIAISTSDGNYLWTTSRHDGTLTRIDPSGMTDPLQIPVASSLQAPFEASGAIWTQSFGDNRVFRVDPSSGEITSFPTDFDVDAAVEGGGYVWVLPKGHNRIQRIDPTTLDDITFSIDADVNFGLFADQSLWVMTETGELIRFDPVTLSPIASLTLPHPVAVLRAANGRLWAFSPDALAVYAIDSAQVEIEQVYLLEAAPRDILLTETRLWVLTADDVLVGYDPEQSAALFTVPLTGDARLWAAFSDGEMLWLPVEDQLHVIRQSDGSEYRQLALCQNFSKPLYDGVNIWISCEKTGEVRYFPARMQYFGVERFNGDLYSHTPIIHSNALWLTQEDSGRVIGYNAELPPFSETLGTPLMPLKEDGEFLWTAVSSEGRLLRLRPRIEPLDLLRPQLEIRSTHDEATVAGEIHSFHLINDHIWILHTRPDQLLEAANLTIVDRMTLEKQEHALATIPAGLAHVDNQVWVSASGLQDDFVYRFDATTGEAIGTPLSLPGIDYASWPPTRMGDTLYFTAGAPPLNAAGKFMVELFLNDLASFTLQPLLYEYDLAAQDWGRVYEIVPAPYAPLNAEPFLWFLSGHLPNAENGRDVGTIFALNPQTDETIGPFSPCRDATMPRASENFVWVGCQQPETQLQVFNRQTGQHLMTYEGIGSDPWPPVTHDGYIWITFRESNNAAAFDSETAALAGIYPLGEAPGAPFVYDNDVWVMNSGEGSIQRLRVEEQR